MSYRSFTDLHTRLEMIMQMLLFLASAPGSARTNTARRARLITPPSTDYSCQTTASPRDDAQTDHLENRHLLNVSDLHLILARYGMAWGYENRSMHACSAATCSSKADGALIKRNFENMPPKTRKRRPCVSLHVRRDRCMKCLLALLRMRVIQSQTPSQNVVYVYLMMQLARYHHLVRSTVT